MGGAPLPSSRPHWNRDRPSAVSLLSFQLRVRLPLATIPPSGKNRSRSILIPANGWFSAHRRMRFTHSSPTGRSMAASISRGRSISAVPGLPGACRRKRCGRRLFWRRWRQGWRSMMMGKGIQIPLQIVRRRWSKRSRLLHAHDGTWHLRSLQQRPSEGKSSNVSRPSNGRSVGRRRVPAARRRPVLL